MWEGGSIQFIPLPVKSEARLRAMKAHFEKTRKECPECLKELRWRIPYNLRSLFE